MIIHLVFITLIALLAFQTNAFVGRHGPHLLSFVADKPGTLSSLSAAEVSASNEWTTLEIPTDYLETDMERNAPLVVNLNNEMFAIQANAECESGNRMASLNCMTGEWTKYEPYIKGEDVSV